MPSYLLQHPDKFLWFIHHYREVYDLWGTEYQPVPNTEEGYGLRELNMRSDELGFKEAKKIFTNSWIISTRLKEFNGIESEVIYPPLFNTSQFHCGGYGDYIYYSSRICRPKRQMLAVEAMRHTKTCVKLVISGRFEQQSLKNEMHSIIKKYNLQNKVIIDDRWISEKEKADYFADCLCGLYIPFDEDSYGYTSLEAHHSQKGIITCTDSGGTDELIIDGFNGSIIPPEPTALAQQFDKLYSDRKLAEEFGKNGLERISQLKINWDNVVGRFTQ
jgi:glycosyltransferase involved in cell wall biosynthesis